MPRLMWTNSRFQQQAHLLDPSEVALPTLQRVLRSKLIDAAEAHLLHILGHLSGTAAQPTSRGSRRCLDRLVIRG
eukprot:scaffold92846_cov27-Tisochrysis_lutea.AAC.5